MASVNPTLLDALRKQSPRAANIIQTILSFTCYKNPLFQYCFSGWADYARPTQTVEPIAER
jgi:hypothetical protein